MTRQASTKIATAVVVCALIGGALRFAEMFVPESANAQVASVGGVGATIAGDKTFTGSITVDGDITLGGSDLTSSKTTETFDILSATADATTSTTVAAITLRSTANIGDADLVLNVESSVGTNLFTVTEGGTIATVGDVNFASDLNHTATGETTITTNTSAASASTTTAAYRFYPNTNLDANDLMFRVVGEDARSNVFTIDYEGDTDVQSLQINPTTVGTCGSGAEGVMRTVTGAATEATRVCLCTFDGTNYEWVNLMVPATRSGDTTTCPASGGL